MVQDFDCWQTSQSEYKLHGKLSRKQEIRKNCDKKMTFIVHVIGSCFFLSLNLLFKFELMAELFCYVFWFASSFYFFCIGH